jgi:opacity protein-like surface antigen
MKVQNYLDSDGTTFSNGGSNPSNTLRGYVLGLGYKQLLSQNIYLFGEGNYYNYGNQSYTSLYANGFADTFNAKATAYQFLVGVGYKF